MYMRDIAAEAETFALTLAAAIALVLVSLALPGPIFAEIPSGLLTSPPGDWIAERGLSVPVAALAVTALGLGALWLNRKFGYVAGTGTVAPSALVMLCAANPIVSGGWCGALLTGIVSMVCMGLAMDSWKSPNATRHIFVAASLASAGMMCDTACIMTVIWIPLAWRSMKALRWRETAAWLMGLTVPWWIAIPCLYGLATLSGMGLAPWIDAWSLPDVAAIPRTALELASGWLATPTEVNPPVLVFLTATGGMLTILIMFNSWVKLYAGNSRVRGCNEIIWLQGSLCLLLMCIDADRLTEYLIPFYYTMSVQFALLFTLWPVPRARLCFRLLLLAIALQWPLLVWL